MTTPDLGPSHRNDAERRSETSPWYGILASVPPLLEIVLLIGALLLAILAGVIWILNEIGLIQPDRGSEDPLLLLKRASPPSPAAPTPASSYDAGVVARPQVSGPSPVRRREQDYPIVLRAFAKPDFTVSYSRMGRPPGVWARTRILERSEDLPDPNPEHTGPGELELLQALRQRSWLAAPHINEVGYEIDIAVHDPSTSTLVAVEVDGRYHWQDPEKMARDRQREDALRRNGWHVVRVRNLAVRDDLRGCVEVVEEVLGKKRGWRSFVPTPPVCEPRRAAPKVSDSDEDDELEDDEEDEDEFDEEEDENDEFKDGFSYIRGESWGEMRGYFGDGEEEEFEELLELEEDREEWESSNPFRDGPYDCDLDSYGYDR